MIPKEIPRLSLEASAAGAEAVQLLFTQQRHFYTLTLKLVGCGWGLRAPWKRAMGHSGMSKWGNDRCEETWPCRTETSCTAGQLHMLQVFDPRIHEPVSVKGRKHSWLHLNPIQSDQALQSISVFKRWAVREVTLLIISWKTTNPL